MTKTHLAGFILAVLAAVPAQGQPKHPWTQAASPAPGAARSIGFYANGCIQGAEALPLDGRGWHVLRPQRNRFWGHPLLIETIRVLARQVHAVTGKAILIADIGRPRGGPASGHASHQIGLDADIRFQLAPDAALDPEFRREGKMVSMLTRGADRGPGREPDHGKDALDRARWHADQLMMLRKAAELPWVDRIFVNPVIKREACRVAGRDRAWLNKVIPWYGHDDHMHVRIRCPDDSPQCRHQAPIPPGDGCGAALAWWFTREPYHRHWTPRKPPAPPAACGLVWRR